MQIEWSQSALADLRDIMAYIKSRNYQAAIDLQDNIESAVEHLAEHPYLYKNACDAQVGENWLRTQITSSFIG